MKRAALIAAWILTMALALAAYMVRITPPFLDTP